MKAMILAAGRGTRMREISQHTPKSLNQVTNKPLLHYHLMALQEAGVNEVVINLHHLGEQIQEYCETLAENGLKIHFSIEETLLGTGGGIKNALHHFDAPFIVVNADVYTDYDFKALTLAKDQLAHLVLTENPAHNPDGDFGLVSDIISLEATPRYTYTGIGMYSPELFANYPEKTFPLTAPLKTAIAQQKVTGSVTEALWRDIGTPERLAEIQDLICA